MLYTKDGSKAAWATNTHERGVGRATLALGDEGILVLVDEVLPLPSRPLLLCDETPGFFIPLMCSP